MTDNGEEFDIGHFRSFPENHDIEIRTSAAFSPWSNGVVERQNAVLSDMVRKLLDDPTVSGDRNIVLQAAVFAKNAMYNKDGFSPFQLVYGYAPRLPSVFVNAPPALECETTSHFVAQHLKTLHEARKLFTEADWSTRIKLALQKQLRHDVGPFSTGEKVFYMRESDKWKGPGVIIGQDGAVVFVRHGGAVVKVHRTRLRHVQNDRVVEDEDDGPHEVAGIQESKKETAAELTDNAHEGVLDIAKSATVLLKRQQEEFFILRVGIMATKEKSNRGHTGTRRKSIWNPQELVENCLRESRQLCR